MGRPITLFGPATLVGVQTVYSRPLDVSDSWVLTLRQRVTGRISINPGEPTLDTTVQHCNNLALGDWETLGSFAQALDVTTEDKVVVASTDKTQRYVRLEFVIADATGFDPGFSLHVRGVLR